MKENENENIENIKNIENKGNVDNFNENDCKIILDERRCRL